MIVAKNITKSFGSLEVLKGIDLTIAKKEVVCIIGTSGAGKTTLLQILGTLSQPTGGSLHINGQDILNMSRSKLAEFRNQNIGFVFQFHHLLPEFTALENVCIPAFIKGTGKKEAEDRAKELLDFFNLSDRLTHKPRELSGGEQQRIAIARALMNKPSVIFADEPSGNLDTKNKEELHEMFLSLRDQFNQTIVIVTHDTSLADKSDRIIKMSDGILI